MKRQKCEFKMYHWPSFDESTVYINVAEVLFFIKYQAL